MKEGGERGLKERDEVKKGIKEETGQKKRKGLRGGGWQDEDKEERGIIEAKEIDVDEEEERQTGDEG
jgi:hypothetical protein